jgi:C_GCAxxG_C_C family probable redox protein
MENKSETAKKYFMQGYNCAQAVLLAFADDLQIDKEFALKLASPFGGGMGGQREVCGAVSAMFMVAGLKRGYSDAKNQEEKKKLYALIKELSDKFKAENGSIICKELLGLQNSVKDASPHERNENYYKKRPCSEITAFAARLAQEI